MITLKRAKTTLRNLRILCVSAAGPGEVSC